MTPIGCQEALQRLYEYLDGELTSETTEEVRRHIELCAGCYPEVRTATEFKQALQRAARGQPLCPEPLRARVAEMLREEGLSA